MTADIKDAIAKHQHIMNTTLLTYICYTSINGLYLSNSLLLEIKHNSIAYTIAEWESRNRDLKVIGYSGKNGLTYI